jgi:anti-anti-sigma regulatory factor
VRRGAEAVEQLLRGGEFEMVKKTKKALRIDFSGKLTVHTIRDQRKRLLAALNAPGPVRIAFHDVSAVDLSFFQTLYAFYRSLLRDKRSISVEQPISPQIRTCMETLGYQRKVSCTEEGEDSCFWKLITTP